MITTSRIVSAEIVLNSEEHGTKIIDVPKGMLEVLEFNGVTVQIPNPDSDNDEQIESVLYEDCIVVVIRPMDPGGCGRNIQMTVADYQTPEQLEKTNDSA